MSEQTGLPDTAEGMAAWIDGLTFHPDQAVPDDQMPPALGEDEDVLVPRSFKIPMQLDARLKGIADRQGISKSELLRRYLEAAVAAELATEGEPDVLIPLSEALRALSGLPRLPRSA